MTGWCSSATTPPGALEVIAIRLPDCLLVLHVQDLQAKFRPYYDHTKGRSNE